MTASPGLSLADEAQHDHGRRWAGVARIAGPVWAQLPSLTVGLFGVQVLWSVEMSYASPYLLSLGLPKSLMAMVFLAGPLSGLIVQPLIGTLADNSKSRFGRRRPFILVSAALCLLATLLLGFTRQFAAIFTTLNSPSNDTLTVWLAVLSIYCIDFSINAVQALDRALLVDTLPTSKQPTGNAWAASMLAVGSVAGFFAGNLDLPYFFPFFRSAQLEVLSLITALMFFLTQAWVCFHVKERVLLSSLSGPKGLRQELKDLWETLLRLPSVIRQICWIQFFASLGWFPVWFYSTVYIGDLHKKSSPIPQSKEAAIALEAESTRLGTRALFYSALVALVANIIMPYFVVSRNARHASSPLEPKHKSWFERFRIHLASLWASSHLIFALCMAATFITSSVSGATWILSVTGFCSAMGQWAPFALLGEAILSHQNSDDAGSIHLADTRSARSMWSLDNDEHGGADETRWLFRADGDEGEEGEGEGDVSNSDPSALKRSLSQEQHDRETDFDVRQRINGIGHARPRASRVDLISPSTPSLPEEGPVFMDATTSGSTSKAEGGNGLSAQAGAVLGIHNIFIVIPQFLVSGLSSIIFAILDPKKSILQGEYGSTQSQPGDESGVGMVARDGEGQGINSLAVVFRLGGIAATIAFVLAYRLAKELKRH